MTMPGGCPPHGAGLGAIRGLTFWQERFRISALEVKVEHEQANESEPFLSRLGDDSHELLWR